MNEASRSPEDTASVLAGALREHVPDVRRPLPGKEKVAEGPSEQPVEFPVGFWRCVDYLLHHPGAIIESVRQEKELPAICRVLFMIAHGMAAIYGAVMGATNLFQGSTLPMADKLMLTGVTALKTPALFLLTLLIILPPVYVSNAFVGARHSLWKILTMLLATTAVTTTLLASMATVACFFALTSRSYHFIKLLHVLFFAYAGLGGLLYFQRCLSSIAPPSTKGSPWRLFFLWIVLYMFVGTQLAWVLRPFVASPGEPFQFFRPRRGNFYESVFYSFEKMIEK